MLSEAAWHQLVFPEDFFDENHMLIPDVNNEAIWFLLHEITRRTFTTELKELATALWIYAGNGNPHSTSWKLRIQFPSGATVQLFDLWRGNSNVQAQAQLTRRHMHVRQLGIHERTSDANLEAVEARLLWMGLIHRSLDKVLVHVDSHLLDLLPVEIKAQAEGLRREHADFLNTIIQTADRALAKLDPAASTADNAFEELSPAAGSQVDDKARETEPHSQAFDASAAALKTDALNAREAAIIQHELQVQHRESIAAAGQDAKHLDSEEVTGGDYEHTIDERSLVWE